MHFAFSIVFVDRSAFFVRQRFASIHLAFVQQITNDLYCIGNQRPASRITLQLQFTSALETGACTNTTAINGTAMSAAATVAAVVVEMVEVLASFTVASAGKKVYMHANIQCGGCNCTS